MLSPRARKRVNTTGTGDWGLVAPRSVRLRCPGAAFQSQVPSPKSPLFQPLLHLRRQQQVVGDGSDLLGLAPRLLEHRELAREGAALRLLVGRHLERQAL